MSRILFAGGGTGGHVYPALAVAEALGDCEMLFVGSRRGIEKRIVASAGYDYEGLRVDGFHRRWTFRNLLFPARTTAAFAAALRLIRRFRPHVVVGTGGFASGPPVLAAQVCRLPTLLQEQNAYPGITTRLLARRCSELHIAFPEAAEHLSSSARRHLHVTGNPVRSSLLAELAGVGDAPKSGDLEARDLPTVLVMGGSQGSRILNRAVLRFIADLETPFPRFRMLWSTGAALYDEVRGELPSEIPIEVSLYPYLDDMASAYRDANLVVCRAGAITCAELALVGRPAVLVPLASAAGDHQRFNSESLARAGAAAVIEEKRVGGTGVLRDVVLPLLADGAMRESMANASRALARPEAATQIAERVRDLAEQRRG